MNRIVISRNRAGWSRAELARKAGLKYWQVLQLELNKCWLDSQKKRLYAVEKAFKAAHIQFSLKKYVEEAAGPAYDSQVSRLRGLQK